ncbi:MAG: hypothetical protein RLZ23_808 [Actinomycetota bacterium]
MVGILQVDRLMEEDIIQGVLGGELETVRDSDRAVHGGAGAPALAHRTPGRADGAGGDFGGELAEQLVDPLRKGGLGGGLIGLAAANNRDEFGNDLRLLRLTHPGRDGYNDPSTLAIGRAPFFATGRADHDDLALIDSRKGEGLFKL